jgi:hypothetical protein
MAETIRVPVRVADIIDSEQLKIIAILCSIGLLVSLLFVTYGVDLSPGIF